MIAFLDGVIDSKGADHLVLNVGGIGFLVRTSTRTAEDAGAPGTETVLHTCLIIRDDNPLLYGFGSVEERGVFLELVSVSGVGPRVAVALLGALRPAELASAIVGGDTALLSRIPGVGKKTAARVCVELATSMERYVAAGDVPGQSSDSEVVEALMALGYSAREAIGAAKSMAPDDAAPLEDRLRRALRALASR